MAKQLTIGEVAKRTGLSTKTIRFYEEEGCIPAVGRNDAGYRQYSEGDVWRLRLVRHIRLLGLPLTEVKSLVTESLNEECAVFASDLTEVLNTQKDAISRRISELEACATRSTSSRVTSSTVSAIPVRPPPSVTAARFLQRKEVPPMANAEDIIEVVQVDADCCCDCDCGPDCPPDCC